MNLKNSLREKSPILTSDDLLFSKECSYEKTPNEVLEFNSSNSKDTSSLNTPVEMEEGKYMLVVPSLEIYLCFSINRKKPCFSIYIPKTWRDFAT